MYTTHMVELLSVGSTVIYSFLHSSLVSVYVSTKHCVLFLTGTIDFNEFLQMMTSKMVSVSS